LSFAAAVRPMLRFAFSSVKQHYFQYKESLL